MRKITVLSILTTLLISCGKDNKMYTLNEIQNFKKGDTIYIKDRFSIEKFVITNNVIDKQLIECDNLKYSYYKTKDIFTYEQINKRGR